MISELPLGRFLVCVCVIADDDDVANGGPPESRTGTRPGRRSPS